MTYFFRIILLSLICIPSLGFSQNMKLEAFRIYNHKGKEVKWKKVIKNLKGQDLILIGELHNNAISHWLQYQIISTLHDSLRPLKIGAEMFESDNQILIDEYFQDLISTKSFEAEARLWNNYSTDYKPILEYAKSQGIPFIGTNIPRRYASAFYYKGDSLFSQLSEEAKNWICPLPFIFPRELDSYKNLLAISGHGGENLAKAQAIKDATMAHFILKNYNSGDLFIHLNGNQHSIRKEAISWYLLQSKPELNILNIHTTESTDLEWKDDYEGLADFILVVDENMTKTY